MSKIHIILNFEERLALLKAFKIQLVTELNVSDNVNRLTFANELLHRYSNFENNSSEVMQISICSLTKQMYLIWKGTVVS